MKELQIVQKGQEWLMTKGPDFLVNVALFIAIIIVGALLVRITSRVLQAALAKAKKVTPELERFTLSVFNKTMWLLVFMIALPRLGVNVAPLVAGLGVSGFIVGFAFQESLSNFAAGLMIIINAPFQVGDYVTVAANSGTVADVTMMSTTLTSLDNKKIIIPNKAAWGAAIVNHTALGGPAPTA